MIPYMGRPKNLSRIPGNEERNTDLGGHNHDGIQQGIAAGEGINPVRDSLIHLYRSFSPQ